MERATIVGQANADPLRRVHGARQERAANGEIAKAVGKLFQASPYAALRSITCEFYDGILVLHGRVTSYHLKQLAQETVRTLAGVGVIVNFVEVTRGANGSS